MTASPERRAEPRIRPRETRLRGRLPAELLYPAGVPGITVRWLSLPSGVRVRVAVAGPKEGPPVVMLAGWGGSLYMYRLNILPLAEAGYRVFAVDLKGQGLSDKPDDAAEYTLHSLTAHLLEVLDALGVRRAALVAQSMAGSLAVRLAIAYPHRVSRLALVSPVGFGRVPLIGPLSRAAGAFAPIAPYLAKRWTFKRAVRYAYGSRGRASARDVDEYWAPSSDPAFVRSLFYLLRQMPWGLLKEEDLRRIRCPVLLFFGTDDRVVLPRDCERLAAVVPDARVVMVPGGGHAALECAPDVVNPALAAFLRP